MGKIDTSITRPDGGQGVVVAVLSEGRNSDHGRVSCCIICMESSRILEHENVGTTLNEAILVA